MSDEQQPELRWAPIQPAPRRRGRVWLIVGLSVAALAIVAVLLFFLLPRSDAPALSPSSPTPTTSSTPSATPTPTQTPSPEPSETSVATPPPVADPTLDAFRGQVSGWLNDAGRGLDIIANAGGPDALPVVDTLQGDAQRLSDAVPPSSIAGQWRDGVETYSQKLASLRSALSSGSGVAAAVDAARSAAQDLKTLVGL